MAKSKAELEWDCAQHQTVMSAAREAVAKRLHMEAMELSVQALNHIDGMMQYERRYRQKTERQSVESIDLILRLAPLLFDSQSLDALASLLKSQRRVEKNTAVDIGENLDRARVRMRDAHHLWDLLEKEGFVRQDELRERLGGDQDEWRWMAEKWEEIGLIRRTPERHSYQLSLVTCLDETVRGKCPSCGVTGKASKERMIQPMKCPKCGAAVEFVLVFAVSE